MRLVHVIYGRVRGIYSKYFFNEHSMAFDIGDCDEHTRNYVLSESEAMMIRDLFDLWRRRV